MVENVSSAAGSTLASLEPLDTFARSVLWLANSEVKSLGLNQVLAGQTEPVLALVAEYADLGQKEIALRILEFAHLQAKAAEPKNPLALYWAAYLAHGAGSLQTAKQYWKD